MKMTLTSDDNMEIMNVSDFNGPITIFETKERGNKITNIRFSDPEGEKHVILSLSEDTLTYLTMKMNKHLFS